MRESFGERDTAAEGPTDEYVRVGNVGSLLECAKQRVRIADDACHRPGAWQSAASACARLAVLTGRRGIAELRREDARVGVDPGRDAAAPTPHREGADPET